MIGVIIPFYKHRDQLDQCLACLRKQTVPVEIFVRDNTHDNIYFTAAVNEGLRVCLDKGCDYVLVLNQDMYLHPDAVEHMLRLMDSRPPCGIAAPLQLSPNDPSTVICGGGMEAWPAGRLCGGPLSQFTKDDQIHWADGACMMLRRQTVEEIGLFDKNLVFIGSDADYSFTARSRGWQVWRASAARGTHQRGGSATVQNHALEVRKVKDMLYFSDKWLTQELYRQLAHPAETVEPERVEKLRQRMLEVIKEND